MKFATVTSLKERLDQALNGAAALIVVIFISSCTSSRMGNRAPDHAFYSRQYEKARVLLVEGLLGQEPDGNDRLLYLLDLGTVLHTMGRYQESNEILQKASDLAEIKDYTSLSQEAATLLTGENAKVYKGENFEKVLIPVIRSLNYASLNDFEGALIESRRVNSMLHRMQTEGGKKAYENNSFAHYLSGVFYEWSGDIENAYVDYKAAQRILPENALLRQDVLRVAAATGRSDDLDRWSKAWSMPPVSVRDQTKKSMPRKNEPKDAELLIVFENGRAPKKVPHRTFFMIPVFERTRNPVESAYVDWQPEQGAAVSLGETTELFSVETAAIRDLEDRTAGIIAKRMAGAAVKLGAAQVLQEATGSGLVGDIARIGLLLSDQADIRSWNWLPKNFQLIRAKVRPGISELQLRLKKYRGGQDRIEEPYLRIPMTLTPGQRKLVVVRYLSRDLLFD